MSRPDALCLVGLLALAALTDAPEQIPFDLDRSSLDQSVRPQDDLYRYVNGDWLARTEIPPDRVTYGAFTELTERAEADLRGVIEQAAASHPRNGSARQQIADLYASVIG